MSFSKPRDPSKHMPRLRGKSEFAAVSFMSLISRDLMQVQENIQRIYEAMYNMIMNAIMIWKKE